MALWRASHNVGRRPHKIEADIFYFFFYLISSSVSTPCRWDQLTVVHLVSKGKLLSKAANVSPYSLTITRKPKIYIHSVYSSSSIGIIGQSSP